MTTSDVTLLRQAAGRLRQRKHSNGFGVSLSCDVADLLDAEADSLTEMVVEAADVEAAGEIIIIMSTTAAAVAVARRVLGV